MMRVISFVSVPDSFRSPQGSVIQLTEREFSYESRRCDDKRR